MEYWGWTTEVLNAGASQTRFRLAANEESCSEVEEGNAEGDACITTSEDEPPPPLQPPAATDSATRANSSANYTLVLPGGFELKVDDDFALVEESSDVLEQAVEFCGGDETSRLLQLLRCPAFDMRLDREFVAASTVAEAGQDRFHIHRGQLRALIHQSRINYLLFKTDYRSGSRLFPWCSCCLGSSSYPFGMGCEVSTLRSREAMAVQVLPESVGDLECGCCLWQGRECDLGEQGDEGSEAGPEAMDDELSGCAAL